MTAEFHSEAQMIHTFNLAFNTLQYHGECPVRYSFPEFNTLPALVEPTVACVVH